MELKAKLEDYRTTHFLFNFLRAQMQGWFTRENILCKAGHPWANSENLNALTSHIDTINQWYSLMRSDDPPLSSCRWNRAPQRLFN